MNDTLASKNSSNENSGGIMQGVNSGLPEIFHIETFSCKLLRSVYIPYSIASPRFLEEQFFFAFCMPILV